MPRRLIPDPCLSVPPTESLTNNNIGAATTPRHQRPENTSRLIVADHLAHHRRVHLNGFNALLLRRPAHPPRRPLLLPTSHVVPH